jgi:hypothetical protein
MTWRELSRRGPSAKPENLTLAEALELVSL